MRGQSLFAQLQLAACQEKENISNLCLQQCFQGQDSTFMLTDKSMSLNAEINGLKIWSKNPIKFRISVGILLHANIHNFKHLSKQLTIISHLNRNLSHTDKCDLTLQTLNCSCWTMRNISVKSISPN